MIYIKYNKNTGVNLHNNNEFIQFHIQNQSRSRIYIHVSLRSLSERSSRLSATAMNSQ